MKKILITIICIIMLLCSIGSIVYAWYTNATSTASFSVKSANVSSSLILYKGIDNNHDGYLELIDGVMQYETNEEWETNPSNSNDTILPLDIQTIFPTQIYTFKINITNRGDVDAYVSFRINDAFLNTEISKAISICIFSENNPNSNYVLCGDLKENDKIFGGTADEKVKRPSLEGDIVYYPENYIVKIKFEEYESLSTNIKNSFSIEHYNELQGNFIENINIFTLILSSNLDN